MLRMGAHTACDVKLCTYGGEEMRWFPCPMLQRHRCALSKTHQLRSLVVYSEERSIAI